MKPKMLMAPVDGAGGGGVSTPPAPATGPDGQPQTPPATGPDGQSRIDHKEIVGLRTETRETKKALETVQAELAKLGPLVQALPQLLGGQKATETTAPAAESKSTGDAPKDPGAQALAEITKLTRNLELEKAMTKAKIEDEGLRELITTAAHANGVAADKIAEFVAKYAPKGATQQAPAKPAAPATDKTIVDGGAPAADPTTLIPDNPLNLSPEMLAAMSDAQLEEYYANFRAKNTRTHNPFYEMERAEARRARGNPALLDGLAKLIQGNQGGGQG